VPAFCRALGIPGLADVHVHFLPPRLHTPAPSGSGLDELEREFPAWHAWRGVGDTGWHARRVKSSPPVVLRAESLTELRDQVRAYLASREHH
jgi:hypothetical protein